MKKIKFIEINYHSHNDLKDPQAVIQKHAPSNLFAQALSDRTEITFVKHADYTGELIRDGIEYHFFKRRNNFLQIPFQTHRLISEKKPDLVLMQGFVFPLQVLFLRKKIGKGPIILVQHRGESPAGKKKIFQKMADSSIDGYIFSAAGNAEPWLKAGIISSKNKCFEMPSASTLFNSRDKAGSKTRTGMGTGINFLWSGRLNANKDPITVLKAFEKYDRDCPDSFLWMIFNEGEILDDVKLLIEKSTSLKNRVKLVGKLPHKEMEDWYNAADYFISASWHESGSFALIEAMACGCIPIVTNIPPAMKAIDNGKAGYFFEPGDVDGLSKVLLGLDHSRIEEFSSRVVKRFEDEFSAKAVANRLFLIYENLTPKEFHNIHRR